MTRSTLLKRTLDNIEKLSDQKLQEVSDFTEFLLNKIDDNQLNEGIKKLATEGKTFQFLEEEEVLYTLSDLKEIYK